MADVEEASSPAHAKTEMLHFSARRFPVQKCSISVRRIVPYEGAF